MPNREELWWGYVPNDPNHSLHVALPSAEGWMQLDTFDSECYGFPMAKFCGASGDRSVSRDLFRTCTELAVTHGWPHLSVRVPAHEVALIQAFEAVGFFTVDVTVSFSQNLPVQVQTQPGVREAEPGDKPTLQRISQGVFEQSRYATDPFLPLSGRTRLTDRWVENDLSGRADKVFVIGDHQPLGYITCLLNEDGIATIDLVAVDRSARGQGIGQRLVKAALAHYSTKAKRIDVGTQLSNTVAVGLYQATGFTLKKAITTLHFVSPNHLPQG